MRFLRLALRSWPGPEMVASSSVQSGTNRPMALATVGPDQ